MSQNDHGDLQIADRIHGGWAWSVADAAALTALVPVALDIGKTAYQQDTGQEWTVTNHVGPAWLLTGGPPVGGALTTGMVWAGVGSMAAEGHVGEDCDLSAAGADGVGAGAGTAGTAAALTGGAGGGADTGASGAGAAADWSAGAGGSSTGVAGAGGVGGLARLLGGAGGDDGEGSAGAGADGGGASVLGGGGGSGSTVGDGGPINIAGGSGDKGGNLTAAAGAGTVAGGGGAGESIFLGGAGATATGAAAGDDGGLGAVGGGAGGGADTGVAGRGGVGAVVGGDGGASSGAGGTGGDGGSVELGAGTGGADGEGGSGVGGDGGNFVTNTGAGGAGATPGSGGDWTANHHGNASFVSTTGGVIVPVMTTAQRGAVTPSNGMIVYDSDLGEFYQYEGGAWGVQGKTHSTGDGSDHTAVSLTDGTRDFTGKVVGVSPTASAHLATKQYTDDLVAAAVDGGVGKDNVDAATTGVLPNNTRTVDVLQADANAEFPTIDGVAPVINQTYLVKNEGGGANHINDGIYELTVLGDGGTDWQLTRRSDMDDGDGASGAFLSVDQGTVNGEKTFRCITNIGSDVVNTDALEFKFWGQTVDHNNLINVGVDDHHAQAHAASHKDGGSDELDVEELASAGAIDTVPRSDGAGAVTMVATIAGFDSDATAHAGSSTNPHSTKLTQYMHKVTAGEVTAGFLTLPSNPINADCITVEKVAGVQQVSKQVVAATGVNPDFDALLDGTDDLHINNNGTGAGLTETIIEDDVLIIVYNA